MADWFAVVALFRHPLGIPIPHTAVIPKSKEGLGQNLATFVEDNFLAEDQVRERVADPVHLDRLAGWLADAGNADRLVARGAVVLDAVLDAVDEDDLVERAAASMRARLREVPTARLAGEGLQGAVLDRAREALTRQAGRRHVAQPGTDRPGRPGHDLLLVDRVEHGIHEFVNVQQVWVGPKQA